MSNKTSAEAGLDTFDKLEIAYEHAYGHNPLKKACVTKAIEILLSASSSTKSGQPVLDVGCGTGKPVSEMLATAGFAVTGIDISPKMIEHARARVAGEFVVADLLLWQPGPPRLASRRCHFSAVFIIFCLLQLTSYAEFDGLMRKYADAVKPGGLLVLGTMPADNYVTDPADYDRSGTWAVDFPTPFMGVMEKTFFLTAQGLVDFVVGMGFRILSNEIGSFDPDDPRCVPEDQQYIIAQRLDDRLLSNP